MKIMQNAECRMQNEQKGSGFRVRGSGKSGQWAVGGGQCIHPSSFILHPSRHGISLMEVLISIFVLSIGLLGLAAIIPLGQMALWETAKADRSGACGRAAIREIQVSRLLDFRYWYWTPGPTLPLNSFWGFYNPPLITSNTIADDYSHVAAGYNDPNYPPNLDSLPFVIDPLGRERGLPEMFGQITYNVYLPRRTLRTMPLTPTSTPKTLINGQLFFWSDDLPFDTTKNSVARPTLVKTSTGVVTTNNGDYSWFFTVMPAASEARIDYTTTPPTVSPLPVAQRRLFNVSVAVCYKRNFQIYVDSTHNFYPGNPTTTNTLEGEHVAIISAVTGFPGMGIGGGTVQLDAGNNINVKENQWVMMYHLHLDNTGNPKSGYPQLNRLNWYRVVGVGKTTDSSGIATYYINLNGPDWDYNLSAALVVVPGVIGVYNTTVELDWDPLWTK
jgi:hypothetical protein